MKPKPIPIQNEPSIILSEIRKNKRPVTFLELTVMIKGFYETVKDLEEAIDKLIKEKYLNEQSGQYSITNAGRFILNKLNMETLCARFRGNFIHAATKLESIIDDILCIYFTQDEEKRKTLNLVVFSSEKITLKSKIDILDFIACKHCKEQYQKYTKDDGTTLLTRLDNFISKRNRVAHRQYYPTDEEISSFDGFNVLFKYLDGKSGKIKPKEINMGFEPSKAVVAEIMSLSNILNELKELFLKNNGF
jgi:hypothetical protein